MASDTGPDRDDPGDPGWGWDGTGWYRAGEPVADEPVMDIRPLSDDVVALDDVYFIPDDADIADIPDTPVRHDRPAHRSVVGTTLTGLGVAGTVAAGVLPWSGPQGLAGIRELAAGRSWLIWLLLTVGAAVVLGVLVLLRPGRRTRWWGAATALAGAVLSGWAVVALPADRAVGPGPGLAAVALLVLAAGQVVGAVCRPAEPGWRWRPAGVAAAVAVVVLACAGFGSASIVRAQDVDATTAAGPPPALTGTTPSFVDEIAWQRRTSVYDVAGSAVLVAGHAQHGATVMAGVSLLDVRTGVERWHHYERGWSVQEAALAANGTVALVVVNTADGTDAIGFDVATGVQRWRQRLGAGFDCASPTSQEIAPVGGCSGQLITGDGVLYAAGGPPDAVGGPNDDGPVTYVAARDGRTWPVPLGTGCRVRGAGGDPGGLYVLDQCVTGGFSEQHLLSERAVAYDLTGRQRWSSPLALVRGTVAGELGPVFVRGDVVLFQQEQRYVAVTTSTGVQLWTTTDSFEPEDTVTNGTLLSWASGVEVVTLDLHTGTELWERDWAFPDEAELPAITADRLYLIQHTIGPNPYSCAADATLLQLDPGDGHDAVPGRPLPGGTGNDCGPDVQDRIFLCGPLIVLVTSDTIGVLARS